MKLRNKKTGEIGELNYYDGFFQVVDTASPLCGNSVMGEYTTFSAINEEWEDYEEPKEFYYIRDDGFVKSHPLDDDDFNQIKDGVGNLISIDNYFETKEQAEKAVEKLKAWKRLKDFGCEFDGWNVKNASSEGDHLLINLYVKDCTGCEELLDLLFGGEE